MNNEQDNLNLREIGIRMRNIRTIYGLKQKQVAEKMSISLSHYSKIEVAQARPSRFFLTNFCEVFGINVQWLKYGEGKPFNELEARESVTQYEPLMRIREEGNIEQEQAQIDLEQVTECVIDIFNNIDKQGILECAEKLHISPEELLRTIVHSRLSEKQGL